MTDPTPDILTGPQKAIAGAILANVAAVLYVVGGLTTGTLQVVCLAVAGLISVIGVPWGVYVTVNRPKA